MRTLTRAGLAASSEHGALLSYVGSEGQALHTVALHPDDGPTYTDGSAMWNSLLGLTRACFAVVQVLRSGGPSPPWKGFAGVLLALLYGPDRGGGCTECYRHGSHPGRGPTHHCV